MKSVAAFTMIEIALALAVIGFALVAIIGVLPAGMSVQRDNRESTIVNFDANFLMSAITGGSTGTDELTNHIIAISNQFTFFNINAAGVPVPSSPHWIYYTTTGTTSDRPITTTGSLLTNGANIISLLTTPKYISVTPTSFYSNYVTADLRAITSSLTDQGTSKSAESFAFAYRIYPEVIPYAAANMPWTNNPEAGPVARNFQANFAQIRLRFRWPILPSGQVGNSRLTFRSAASGQFVLSSPLATGWVISNALIHASSYGGVP